MLPTPYNESKPYTPRSMARAIVLQELDGAFYWQEHRFESEVNEMTYREKELVSQQVEKLVTRFRKLLKAKE